MATDLWSKVDFARQAPATPTPAPAQGGVVDDGAFDRVRQHWRKRRRFLDVVGSFVWLYAIVKVFVADFDTSLFGTAASYRFFFFLALAAVVAVVMHKRWAIVTAFIYVLAFPAVVLCWKLPKLLRKARSPVAFLAAANVVTLVLSDLKRSIVLTALTVFATLAIVASHWEPLLVVAGVCMSALVVRTAYRSIRMSLKPSSFLIIQQTAIRKMVESNTLRQLTTPAEELLSADIEQFTAEQQITFTNNLGNGVLAHRVLSYWAYQLERYRRSPASLIFNLLSYLWLVVRVVAGLALINLALYHAHPADFIFKQNETFLLFIRYVIAALAGQEIIALHGSGNVADAINIVTFGAGLILSGGFFLSSALAFRASREESQIKETVAEIKREGKRLDERLLETYDVSVVEAMLRLEQLKATLVGVIRFVSTRIPDGFDEQHGGRDPSQH
jgi:hypothetical protein